MQCEYPTLISEHSVRSVCICARTYFDAKSHINKKRQKEKKDESYE